MGRSLQAEETARALTKGPDRKPRVCIKTSVQMKLKGGLRELLSYHCWVVRGRERRGSWWGMQWCSWQWVETLVS